MIFSYDIVCYVLLCALLSVRSIHILSRYSPYLCTHILSIPYHTYVHTHILTIHINYTLYTYSIYTAYRAQQLLEEAKRTERVDVRSGMATNDSGDSLAMIEVSVCYHTCIYIY